MEWVKCAATSAVAPLLLVCSTGTIAAAAERQLARGSNLLTAPENPLHYFEIKLRTRNLLDSGKAAEAEPLAEQLARAYPRDGENWFLLAQARETLDKYHMAAAAYEKAASILGWQIVEFPHDPDNTRYALGILAATSHLKAGDRRAALDLLRKLVEEHHYPFPGELFDHEAGLADLRDDPEFREIAGRPDTKGWSRDYGWRRDIDFLSDAVHRVNPDFRGRELPAEFIRRREELKDAVPDLSDEQIFVGMNRMLATLRQGHTWLFGFPSDHPDFRQLPVQFYVFPEGVFIFDAPEPNRDLIGWRLVAINGVSAEEILRRVNEMQSVDGEMEYLLTGPGLIRKTYVLKGLGVIDTVDEVSLTLSRPGKRSKTVRLATVPSGPGTKLKPPSDVRAPLYLRNVKQAHWEQLIPEYRAVYVQLNQLRDDPDETLVDFGRRLRSVLGASEATNLIIDMRHNTGGATGLYPEFLRSIAAFSQDPAKQVYVIIGRSTYSAAGNLITDLERFIRPIFVGEASSECCRLHGDPDTIVLPYSGITGAATAVEWNLSHNVFDGRREISPHVPVVMSAQDYFSGRDPVLEVVLKMAERRQIETSAR